MRNFVHIHHQGRFCQLFPIYFFFKVSEVHAEIQFHRNKLFLHLCFLPKLHYIYVLSLFLSKRLIWIESLLKPVSHQGLFCVSIADLLYICHANKINIMQICKIIKDRIKIKIISIIRLIFSQIN